LPTGGNFLPLLLLSALRTQPEPTVLPPGVGTGVMPDIDAGTDPAEVITQQAGSTLPARRDGPFEPLLRTAHRVIELLRPTEVGAMDPICVTAPASAPAAPQGDASSALAPAVTIAAAVAQAAPDMLAALMKRMTQQPATGEPTQVPDDSAKYVPVVEGTGAKSADGAPLVHEIKQFIDALPKQRTVAQATASQTDSSPSRIAADAPSAPMFVDGQGMRVHSAAAQLANASGANLHLDVPMRSPEWAQALGERITWLIDQQLSTAQIKLNPPQLGPIAVRIALSGDSTQVSVSAHSLITRDALEAAAPRLREALTAHGLGNVSVDVSQQSFSDRSMAQSGSDARNNHWEPWQALNSDHVVASMPRAFRHQAAGRLDAYA
jgi:flagellar hook-length control protein FliK